MVAETLGLDAPNHAAFCCPVDLNGFPPPKLEKRKSARLVERNFQAQALRPDES